MLFYIFYLLSHVVYSLDYLLVSNLELAKFTYTCQIFKVDVHSYNYRPNLYLDAKDDDFCPKKDVKIFN